MNTHHSMPKIFLNLKIGQYCSHYNCDGKKDLMTWVSQGARVFKNVSQPNQSIQFQLEYPYIVADGTANAYVARTDHPCVADFDNDGDADMISVYILGSYYIYYKKSCKRIAQPLRYIDNGNTKQLLWSVVFGFGK